MVKLDLVEHTDIGGKKDIQVLLRLCSPLPAIARSPVMQDEPELIVVEKDKGFKKDFQVFMQQQSVSAFQDLTTCRRPSWSSSRRFRSRGTM